MTLNNLLNTVLLTQKLTIVNDIDSKIIIVDKQKYDEIPYVDIAEFLDYEVLMVAPKYEDNESILYLAIVAPLE